MSSHAALGVVRAGVAVLKGEKAVYPEYLSRNCSDNCCRYWRADQLYLAGADRRRG
jgi:hypothetical protein